MAQDTKSTETGHPAHSAAGARPARSTKALVSWFAAIIVVWVVLDRATKHVFNAYAPGTLVGGPYAGLIQFRLVHNTGAAWGMFENSTMALGIISLVVCAVLAICFFSQLKRINWAETIGLALIIGGGIGNAIDRFAQGYVVDFIETAFMDFPVFNIADTGVTCGFVILFIGIAIAWHTEARTMDQEGSR